MAKKKSPSAKQKNPENRPSSISAEDLNAIQVIAKSVDLESSESIYAALVKICYVFYNAEPWKTYGEDPFLVYLDDLSTELVVLCQGEIGEVTGFQIFPSFDIFDQFTNDLQMTLHLQEEVNPEAFSTTLLQLQLSFWRCPYLTVFWEDASEVAEHEKKAVDEIFDGITLTQYPCFLKHLAGHFPSPAKTQDLKLLLLTFVSLAEIFAKATSTEVLNGQAADPDLYAKTRESGILQSLEAFKKSSLVVDFITRGADEKLAAAIQGAEKKEGLHWLIGYCPMTSLDSKTDREEGHPCLALIVDADSGALLEAEVTSEKSSPPDALIYALGKAVDGSRGLPQKISIQVSPFMAWAEIASEALDDAGVAIELFEFHEAFDAAAEGVFGGLEQ